MPKPASPADFLAAGDIAGLIEHHRARWGDLRMEAGADGGGEQGADPGQQAADPVPQPGKPEGDRGFPEGTPVAEMTDAQRVEYWKHQARKHEQAAKARSDYDKVVRERDEALRKAETADEKALREAREAGAAEVRTAAQQQALSAAATIALRAKGVAPDDAEAFVAETNLTAFLTEDGQVDHARLLARVDRYAGTASGTGGKVPDMGQGRRGGNAANTGLKAGAELYDRMHGKTTTTH